MIEKTLGERIVIRKFSVGEIPWLLNTDLYRNMPVKPISVPRALSYYNNPRADEGDIVIYVLFVEEQMVGFRTILPDWVFKSHEKIKFGWCSGNWISPQYRRNGYSSLILEEALNDWNKKLMYTNFAPASHMLFNKTQRFRLLVQRVRYRFFANIDLQNFLRYKHYWCFLKPFIPVLNAGVEIAAKIKYFYFKPYDLSHLIIDVHSRMPDTFMNYAVTENSLYSRREREFLWAEQYPWLSSAEEASDIDYPFSLYEQQFEKFFIEIKDKKGNAAHLMLSARSGNLKLLYFFDAGLQAEAAMFLMNFCYHQKFKTFTLMDNELLQSIIRLRKPFIGSRKFNMGIYTSFSLPIDPHAKIHDGDGDYMFT